MHGWLQIESPSEVSGLGILVKRDTGLVSESPAIVKPDRTQNFAHVAVGSGWQNELGVCRDEKPA